MSRTHVDLFSGIGGFALAAQAHDVRTVVFCERDQRCRAFLQRAWAGVPVCDDVRTFPGADYRGAWLLTAGVPCQPASRAGKQRGASDDRWLWGAACAALAVVQPTWALFENPPGIGDVGLAGILADVESCGYEVQVVSLPAAAVGSPQRRERYWILCHVADTDPQGRNGATVHIRKWGPRTAIPHATWTDGSDVAHARRQSGQRGATEQDTRRDLPCEWDEASDYAQRIGDVADTSGSRREVGGVLGGLPRATECGDARQAADVGRAGACDMADTERERRQRRAPASREAQGREPQHAVDGLRAARDAWNRSVWVPCADGKLRRAPDSALVLVDGRPVDLLDLLAEKGWPHRSILGALGNAVVWQVAAEIIGAMVQSEGEEYGQAEG